MPKKTILFDLDGTLLPIDTDRFVYQYMKELSAHVEHMIPPEVLIGQIMVAIKAMVANTDTARTNAQIFADSFFPAVNRTEAELMPYFADYYQERFPALRSTCPGLPGIGRAVVQSAVDQGYEIVLATNPLFPRVAIEQRMRWIGVEHMPWRLVTVYEEMHACKPQPAYYREVLAVIGRTPDECLMVGNDVIDDGAAAQVGIDLFFVTDYLINVNDQLLPPDRSGSLANFHALLKSGL